MRIVALLLTLLLAACGNLNQATNDLNTSFNQLLGTYSAPLLAGSPRPSGCSDQKCRALDEPERVGYEKARRKEITWTRLVDAFYEGRRRLYPDSNDSSAVYEYQAFQRALAEQLDAGRMTESQWSYLVERKSSEIRERQRTGRTTCNTTNIGTTTFPNYQTVCR
jgi:hypothetical protein